ncbi:hypothetical protein BH11MYX3_BH11MYX3_44060 [soil metagenome]
MRALLIAGLLVGCGGASPVGSARFRNAPPVWKVDDRHDVPKVPAGRAYLRASYYVESFHKLATNALDLKRPRRALGTNSIDEVPDSTWFTNRVNLTPDDIRRGPLPDTPERYFPWTITAGKSGGKEVGFIAKDARGEKFVLKFDPASGPEVETAADAITARLLWAAGYNAASDHVVYFRRADLQVDADAHATVGVKKVPIDDKYLDEKLALIAHDTDGRIRGIASMYIKGKPIGGAPRYGVRADDPNDRIPHQLRRDLRGLAVFFAWLSHTDVKEDNTVDAWHEDPADKAVHYVTHYLIDFGWALGADAAATKDPSVDYRYGLYFNETLISIFSLGLVREVWEGRERPHYRGIGLFSAKDYYPGKWKPTMPSQFSVLDADRFDKLWASKILIRFTPEQLAAAVDAGRLTDPASSAYLLQTLIARQRITAAHWFRRASPLDEVTVTGDHLCFADLALRYKLESASTRFTIRSFDERGAARATTAATADTQGRACTPDLPLAPGPEHYTIYRIESSRGTPPMLVHVATDPAGAPRVVGIHRL